MADCCAGACAGRPVADARYRKVLWIALAVNLSMFMVEIASSWHADSAALLADAMDFLGDAANYGLTLWVLGWSMLWRSYSALFKGWVMGSFGLLVLVRAIVIGMAGQIPAAETMGWISMLAFSANGVVAALLYAFRSGDANMRAVWLCTRNDMIANLAVLLAAFGVWQSGTGWPDLAVAGVMALLGLSSAYEVIRRAQHEIRDIRQNRATASATDKAGFGL